MNTSEVAEQLEQQNRFFKRVATAASIALVGATIGGLIARFRKKRDDRGPHTEVVHKIEE